MFKLRDYQENISKQAVQILNDYGLVCFAIMMRCGKTLTSLETARKYGAKNVLFVTKLIAISSIEADYAMLNPDFDIKIINYESLHKVKGAYDFIIVDECHKCGAFPKMSVATKTLQKIAKNLPCIFMSGTFSPESYSQVYHILSISSFSPFKEYKSFYKWANDYVIKKTEYMYNREIINYSQAIKEKIDENTKHLFISYSQAEAGFKQEVIEEVLTVKMKEGTYLLADKLIKKKVHIGRNGEEILADTAVKLQQKLQQIYSGTVLAENGQATAFDHTKVMFIKQAFEGKKIAIYYKFKAEELMIRARIPNITTDPMEFNACSDKTFISQISSGREGVNLSTADAIVMLNIDFSALSYFQVKERMQHKDRSKPALLYWIFSEGGIEGKIYEAVMNKKDYTLSYFVKDYGIKRLQAQ